MNRIDEDFIYHELNIHVFRGLPDANDMNWDQEVRFTVTKPEEIIEGTLVLKPLWLFDDDEKGDSKFHYKLNYEFGDYFQHTFKSKPTRSGIGSAIHEIIIQNRNIFSFNNVYSTNSLEDGYGYTVDANAFWLKRVELCKAIKNDKLNRYQILFG